MSDVKYWKIEKMLLSSIALADYNPRTITQKAFDGLSSSLQTFGLVQPIVWNERSGNIVGGHQRFRALHNQGVKETEVVIVDFDENEEVSCNIVLNSPSVRGHFTSDVKEMLDDAETELGGVFDAIGLDDLRKEINKTNFDGDLEGDKDPSSKPDDGDSGDGLDDLRDDKIPPERVGIICPRCRSVFRGSNNEILRNEYGDADEQEEENDIDF